MNSYYERLFSTIVPSVDTEAALDENVSTPAKIFDLRVVRKLAVMRVFNASGRRPETRETVYDCCFDVPGNLRFPGARAFAYASSSILSTTASANSLVASFSPPSICRWRS